MASRATFTAGSGSPVTGGTNGGGFVAVSATFPSMFAIPVLSVSDALGNTGVFTTNLGNGQAFSVVSLSDNSVCLAANLVGALFAYYRYECFAHIP